MDVTRTEEEQLEALKKWWADNSLSVIGGLVIGLGAIFGWRGWQAYQLEQAAAASDIYATMIVEMRQQKNDRARELAGKLLAEFKSTTYASFASLALARLDVEASDFDAAANHLQRVMDQADQDELKHLARLRLARVLLDSGKPEQALDLLNIRDQGDYVAGYEELRGDIHLRLGHREQARAAYQLALAGMDERLRVNSYLEMKIDDLGRHVPE